MTGSRFRRMLYVGLWLTSWWVASPAAVAFSEETVLRIGVAEFPPFKYKSPEGKIIGSDTEIIEQVFARMNSKIELYMQPWKRVQEAGMQGEFTAIYTFTKSPEREQFFIFTDPISTVQDVFYKLKKNKFTWNTLDDLKDRKVGVSGGYSYAQPFRDAVAQNKFRVEEVTGDAPELRNLKKLASGRVDLFICEVSVCQYFIHQQTPELDELDFLPNSIGPVRTFHMGFSRKWPGAEQLVAAFNAELAKFVKEGQRKKIFRKYNIVTDLE